MDWATIKEIMAKTSKEIFLLFRQYAYSFLHENGVQISAECLSPYEDLIKTNAEQAIRKQNMKL